MKLEVGKYYKTRNGRKARIICNNRKSSSQNCNFVALVESDNFEYTVYCSEDGRQGNFENCFDLISEWTDKPEFDWSKAAAWHVAVAKSAINGKWYAFDEIPEYIYSYGSSYYPGELIPDEYAPVWDGDIKDSIIIRPDYKA